jgi:hypothetical protein
MDLLEAVSATYAVVGQEISDLGLRTVVMELTQYPEPDVQRALAQCRKELRRITLADILERLAIRAADQHLGGQVAWAKISALLTNESLTVCWTEEMAEAFGVASALAADPIAARMAFLEAYDAAVHRATNEGRKPKWTISLGWDVNGREPVIREAVRQGLIPYEQGQRLCPLLPPPDEGMLGLTTQIGN